MIVIPVIYMKPIRASYISYTLNPYKMIKAGDKIHHAYYDMHRNKMVIHKDRTYTVKRVAMEEGAFGLTEKYYTHEGTIFSSLTCVKSEG